MTTALTRPRLTRSSSRKMVAGVCGGLARYTGLNRWLIRAIWLGSVLAAGSGVLFYLMAAFVIPEDGEKTGPIDIPPQGRLRRSRSDRLLSGVCAGIAGRFGLDVSVVRLLWVLASLGSLGLGVIAYLGLTWALPTSQEATPGTAALVRT